MDFIEMEFRSRYIQWNNFIHRLQQKEISKFDYYDENPFEEFRKNGKEVEFRENEEIPKKMQFCRFCYKNGEPKHYYESHDLKSLDGTITCDVLRKFVCPVCKATGDFAHTLKYCPYNDFPRKRKV